jgi:2'-phosphotransferase
MNNSNKTNFSKTISFLLRHGAIEHNLKIDKQGYVEVKELLSNNQLRNLSFEDLKYIVSTDTKGRFDLKLDNDKYYIRANQGHSTKVGNILNDEEILEELIEPLNICLHGTYKKNLDSINKIGLCKMNRKHIHFTDSLTSKSGIRSNCDAIIYIDMKKAMDDGIKFYKSKNGVILSSGINGIISPKYFI